MPMKGTGKRRLVVLGVASALATVGIVVLAVKAFGRAPEWLTAAAVSPLAVWCIVLMVGGVAVLGVVAALLIVLRPVHTDPYRARADAVFMRTRAGRPPSRWRCCFRLPC